MLRDSAAGRSSAGPLTAQPARTADAIALRIRKTLNVIPALPLATRDRQRAFARMHARPYAALRKWVVMAERYVRFELDLNLGCREYTLPISRKLAERNIDR